MEQVGAGVDGWMDGSGCYCHTPGIVTLGSLQASFHLRMTKDHFLHYSRIPSLDKMLRALCIERECVSVLCARI